MSLRSCRRQSPSSSSSFPLRADMAPSAALYTPHLSRARAPRDGGNSGECQPPSLPLPRRESWRRRGPARCSRSMHCRCPPPRCYYSARRWCCWPTHRAESRHCLAAPPCFSLRLPAREASAAPPLSAREIAGAGCVGHPRSLRRPSVLPAPAMEHRKGRHIGGLGMAMGRVRSG
jgi:hypothetical protein